MRQKPSFEDENCLELHSVKGEYIGQGRLWRFSGNEAAFTAGYANQQAERGLCLRVRARDGTHFNLEFAGPNGKLLAPGHYQDAARFPFQNTAQPGLNVDGCGRGNNRLSGSFVIYEIVYGHSGPARLAADFVQYGEGDRARVLRGSIRYYL